MVGEALFLADRLACQMQTTISNLVREVVFAASADVSCQRRMLELCHTSGNAREPQARRAHRQSPDQQGFATRYAGQRTRVILASHDDPIAEDP